ncbi:MAG TPA: hypothetical protein VE817_08140 [Candidatus Acidoferrum sp.]|nr:hypothetical protein [Candidatus Acidoferrum sp.]
MIPSDGIGKERSDVNSLKHFYVAAHLDEMRKSAADERLARSLQIERPSRVGALRNSLWSLLNGSAERPVVLPNLTNYPYRG